MVSSVATGASILACNGSVPQNNCGLNIRVKETSNTTTNGTLHQLTAIGSNAMTMLGTASVCGNPGSFAAGTGFNEFQNIALNSGFAGSLLIPA